MVYLSKKQEAMKTPTLFGRFATNLAEISSSIFRKERKIKAKEKNKSLKWNDLKNESPEDLKKALQRCQRKLISPNPSNIKAEIHKMHVEALELEHSIN